jgi:glycosyltransferase involved in cell wall biosynthesis
MRALKIGWDNRLARRDRAGTGTYAARLLHEFQKRTDLQLEVWDGGSPRPGTSSFADRALRNVKNIAWTHVYLPALAWKKNVDLLHAPAFLAPTLSPCPVVMTIHDVSYILYPSHFPRWWVTYMKLAMPAAVRSAAAIICGSQHSKADIARTYKVSGNRIHVIPYGVDQQRFRPGVTLDRQWAQRLGIREDYVLHVGTLSYRKNIPTLLRAISRLRSRGKWGARQLVLAGSGESGLRGAQAVYDMISGLDLGNVVVLAGHVPDEYVPGMYANAGVLVMPSLYEGFGFPVLESMASGTPVIASDTSSLPEVAGDAAILFPPQDEVALASAIEEVLEKKSLADELRRKGLARAAEFSWERCADETVKVYRTIA